MSKTDTSVPPAPAGQRPPVDPDIDTVAIPRMGDELNGEDEVAAPDDGDRED